MESNFGDVLGVAMKSLPSEVSGKFLQALSGLSASESSELCRYVIQLEVEKKFRVIHAMSSSSIGGKKVFMNNLKKKLLEKQNIPDVKDKDRGKLLSAKGGKWHSSQSVYSTRKEAEGILEDRQVEGEGMKLNDRRNVLLKTRAAKSSPIVTEQEISQVGQLLLNSHIGKSSEWNLQRLEKQEHASPKWSAVPLSKRERPQSNWELVKNEQSAERRIKSDGRLAMRSGNRMDSTRLVEDGETKSASTCAGKPASAKSPKSYLKIPANDRQYSNIPVKDQQYSAIPANLQQYPNAPAKQQYSNSPPNLQHQNIPAKQQYSNSPASLQYPNAAAKQQYSSSPANLQYPNIPAKQQFANAQYLSDQRLNTQLHMKPQPIHYGMEEIMKGHLLGDGEQLGLGFDMKAGKREKVITPSSERRGSDALNEEEHPTTKRWTKFQDESLRASVKFYGEKNWKAIAERVPGRNHAQCLQRWRKVLKPGLVKGHWSYEEDQILDNLVRQGVNNWGQISDQIPGRTPKQCRERWKNHLDPQINKGPYMEHEDKVILEAQARLGNKWSQIAQMLKGRTEDSVKIRWKSLKQNPNKAANRTKSASSGWKPKEFKTNSKPAYPLPHPNYASRPPAPFTNDNSMTDLLSSINTNDVMNYPNFEPVYFNYGTTNPSFASATTQHSFSPNNASNFNEHARYGSSKYADTNIQGSSSVKSNTGDTYFGEMDNLFGSTDQLENLDFADANVDDLEDLVNTVEDLSNFDFDFNNL